ncbi:hypothetical protein PFISCL1PPCAC_18920, partial [Pristionchus fissidentatus]
GRFSLNGSRGFYSFQHDPLPSSTLPTVSPVPRLLSSSPPTYSCVSFRSRLLAVCQLLFVFCSLAVFVDRFMGDSPIDYLFLIFNILFPLPTFAVLWMVMKCDYSSGSSLSSRSRDLSSLLSLLSFAFLLTSIILFIREEMSAIAEKDRPMGGKFIRDLLFYSFSSLLHLLCSINFSSLHSHYKDLVFSTLRTRNTLPNRLVAR